LTLFNREKKGKNDRHCFPIYRGQGSTIRATVSYDFNNGCCLGLDVNILPSVTVDNGRLNILAQENTFTDTLKFVSIDDMCLIDRFCIDILPRIHQNVKYFIFDPVFMERILVATTYPNLNELKIFHFQQQIVFNYFTGKH